MTINDIIKSINARVLTDNIFDTDDIKKAYCCDMLSLIMKNAEPDVAIITIQNNMNVVAVSVLMECKLIILAESVVFSEECIKKANEEKITVISSPLSAFEICGIMYRNNVESVKLK